MGKKHLLQKGIVTLTFVFFIMGSWIGNGSLAHAAQAKDENEDVPGPVFSSESGFYNNEFELTLSEPEGLSGGTIVYTTECYLPRADGEKIEKGKEYTEPIFVKKRGSFQSGVSYTEPFVVSAIYVDPDGNCSDVVTKTYFCGADRNHEFGDLAVISILMDPEDLDGEESGLFTHPDERGREWEKEARFTYFNPEGEQDIFMNVGVRLHGNMSREWDLKSLRLYARKEYDDQNKFEYDFFQDSPIPCVTRNGEPEEITTFKRLILRDGGNEGGSWGSYCMLRDAFTQSIATPAGKLDVQSYEPAVVYLNQTYYGLLNIRERQDSYYIASHYNCDRDDVCIVDFTYDKKTGAQIPSVYDGDEDGLSVYQDFYEFVKNNDLSVDENYDYVCEKMDMEDYMEYMALQIFCGNGDWPGNNCRVWYYTGEPSDEYGLDGKIRFLVFDTEQGMGMYGHSPITDYFGLAMEEGSIKLPNQDGSTVLFRKLMANEEFRRTFASRYMDLLNSDYNQQCLYDRLSSMMDRIRPAFRVAQGKYHWSDLKDTEEDIQKYIEHRRDAALREIRGHADAGSDYTLSIRMDGVEGLESVDVNTITGLDGDYPYLQEGCWVGQYADNIPVTVTVHPAEGYVFIGWGNKKYKDSEETTLVITEGKLFGAVKLVPTFARVKEDGSLEPVANPVEKDKPNKNSATDTRDWGKIYLAIGLIAAAVIFFVVYAIVAVKEDRKKKKELEEKIRSASGKK